MNMWTDMLPPSKRPRKVEVPNPQTLANKALVLEVLSANPSISSKSLADVTGLKKNALRRARSLAFKELSLSSLKCEICSDTYNYRIRARKFAELCKPCAVRQSFINHRKGKL